MLAATLSTLAELRFPSVSKRHEDYWLASPKLDGFRCTVQEGRPLTRSLKSVPNLALREALKAPVLEGLDGELMVHGMDLHGVDSVYTRRAAKLPAQWYFGVFDHLPKTSGEPYIERYQRATEAVKAASTVTGTHVVMVPQVTVRSVEDVLQFESRVLAMGFEGVVLRRAMSRYKHGRSSLADGALLKWKRFADAEAEVIGFEPSSTVTGALGAFIVRDLMTQSTFKVGTGLTSAQRIAFWRSRPTLRSRIIRYKHYLSSGEKPPSAVFLGFRSRDDI